MFVVVKCDRELTVLVLRNPSILKGRPSFLALGAVEDQGLPRCDVLNSAKK